LLIQGAAALNRPVLKFLTRQGKTTITAYLFMAPALVILIAFVIYPIMYGIPLAFTDYSVINKTNFIGWANFTKAFKDRTFWISVRNSALFVLVVPPLQLLSICLATILNRRVKGSTFFKVLYYIPVVTSMIAIAITWRFLLEPNGIVNHLLISQGLISRPILFLNNAVLILPTLMIITMWQGAGYYMMMYLAGLQSVPKELEEAAYIDGAGHFLTFMCVTLPMLKPFIWFCSLRSLIAALSVFDIVFAIFGQDAGGRTRSAYVINYYTYDRAFVNFEFGYASAIGLVAAVVISLFGLTLFFYGRKDGMSFYD
jgi:putative chitobiose transport system permease protein